MQRLHLPPKCIMLKKSNACLEEMSVDRKQKSTPFKITCWHFLQNFDKPTMIQLNCQFNVVRTFGSPQIVKVVSDTTLNGGREFVSTQEDLILNARKLREVGKNDEIIIQTFGTDGMFGVYTITNR